MGAADRTVQHLHLRAPSAQAAVRAVHRLEDALRCASLPDTGERVLLVRQLRLGRLPVGLSSQSLSLLIEQRVAAVGGEWVHGDDERAARSNAVFFANRLQAAQVALQRRARGEALGAWYWPLALPGVAVQAAPAVFLRQLVESLGAWPGAPVTLPALVAHAVSGGAADWLVAHADAAVVQRLWELADLQQPAWVSLAPVDAAPSREGVVWRDAQGRPQAVSAVSSASAWLAAVLQAASWRAQAGVVPGTRRPVAEASPADPQARSVGAKALDVEAPVLGTAVHGRLPSLSGGALAAADGHSGSSVFPAMARAVEVGSVPSAPEPAVSPGACSAGAPPPLHADRATLAGGLLFVLPVLERLGFADWQAGHRDSPLCSVILLQALLHLHSHQPSRLPVDDPAWALVASLPSPAHHTARAWTIPPSWSGLGLGALHGPAQPTPADAMARLWLIAVRRYLRRVGGIGLPSLCLRPARVGWTDTHLDVRFALTDADLCVRRLALDLDPGWLPWLGRVVAFVYEDARP